MGSRARTDECGQADGLDIWGLGKVEADRPTSLDRQVRRYQKYFALFGVNGLLHSIEAQYESGTAELQHVLNRTMRHLLCCEGDHGAKDFESVHFEKSCSNAVATDHSRKSQGYEDWVDESRKPCRTEQGRSRR